jgi:hypothetical protein
MKTKQNLDWAILLINSIAARMTKKHSESFAKKADGLLVNLRKKEFAKEQFILFVLGVAKKRVGELTNKFGYDALTYAIEQVTLRIAGSQGTTTREIMDFATTAIKQGTPPAIAAAVGAESTIFEGNFNPWLVAAWVSDMYTVDEMRAYFYYQCAEAFINILHE